MCFLRGRAKCGGPSFTPIGDLSKVEVEYIEYREAKINVTTPPAG